LARSWWASESARDVAGYNVGDNVGNVAVRFVGSALICKSIRASS
jgi:hypothetical protein